MAIPAKGSAMVSIPEARECRTHRARPPVARVRTRNIASTLRRAILQPRPGRRRAPPDDTAAASEGAAATLRSAPSAPSALWAPGMVPASSFFARALPGSGRGVWVMTHIAPHFFQAFCPDLPFSRRSGQNHHEMRCNRDESNLLVIIQISSRISFRTIRRMPFGYSTNEEGRADTSTRRGPRHDRTGWT